MKKDRIIKMVSEVRNISPLIHNITNYVTVNDCANAVLAIGASPIMADDISEVADITSISKALVINIGTLNQRIIESMLVAGLKANELNIPVVLDPVGAGASKLRNDTVDELLKKVRFTIIRGNLSEISYIAGLSVSTKGVDSAAEDANNDAVSVAKKVAKEYNCIAAVTGAIDVITDGIQVAKLSNGNKLLSKVTGTGCMSSAITGSYAGVVTDENEYDYFDAAVAGIASMGIAGELAMKVSEEGTGSYHIEIINALSKLNEELMNKMIKINIEECE